MNLRSKCVTKGCLALGRSKSNMLLKQAGFGAPNDRVRCPTCGTLMQVVRSVIVEGKAAGKILHVSYRKASHAKRIVPPLP
jgi:hypothetical protein